MIERTVDHSPSQPMSAAPAKLSPLSVLAMMSPALASMPTTFGDSRGATPLPFELSTRQEALASGLD
jgi:hypothetical protein